MKAILTKRTIIIFSTALLLAFITIISVNVFNSSGPVTGFANTVTRPVRALATTVASAFGDIFSAIYRYEALEKRNEELVARIAILEANYRAADELAEENNRLRALQGFRERHGGYEHEMASLIGRGSDNFSSTFTINMGYANSKIERGMAVATEEGVLIGQVHDVGAAQSTVITILDTKFSAAAYVGRRDTGDEGDSSATVRGDFTYMRSGLLMLEKFDADLIVRKGDTVITSGIGGVFPAGLIVGEVDVVSRNDSGISRFATVRPLLDLENISLVFVITGFESTEQRDT
ncbi:MAG: rod shape-determining protein MreC [Oscillospiraceae bacterium]|nr:rod shape-determining protein MreC [Oscillospiraceae bacterium]